MDEFEIGGIWTLPGDDAGIAGTLRFDPVEGFQLAIPIRGLGAMGLSLGRSADDARVPVLRGVTQSGKHILLLDAILASSSVSFPGGVREEYRALRGFSASAPCDPEPTVARATLTLDYLRDWVVTHPASVSWSSDSANVMYNYQRPADEVLTAGPDWSISLSHVSTQGAPSVDGFNLRHECKLTFDFDPPRAWHSVLEDFVEPFQKFLSFCVDRSAALTSLTLRPTLDADPIDAYVTSGRASTRTGPLHSAFMLLSKPDAGEDLPKVLNGWLTMDEGAREATSLMVALGGREGVPSDLRFLAAAQALEALARADAVEDELSSKEFRRRRAAVADAVEDPGIRAWVMEKLRFANRKSASRLLREYLDELGGFPRQLAPNLGLFLTDHRDNRNFYTHRDQRNGKKLLSPGGLYIHTQGVLLLLKAGTLSLLGFPADRLAGIVGGASNASQWLARVSAMYPSASGAASEQAAGDEG